MKNKSNTLPAFFSKTGMLLVAGIITLSIFSMAFATYMADSNKEFAESQTVEFQAEDFAFDTAPSDYEMSASGLDTLLVEPAAGVPNQKNIRLFEDTLKLYESYETMDEVESTQ